MEKLEIAFADDKELLKVINEVVLYDTAREEDTEEYFEY
jgi:hypothetical protein